MKRRLYDPAQWVNNLTMKREPAVKLANGTYAPKSACQKIDGEWQLRAGVELATETPGGIRTEIPTDDLPERMRAARDVLDAAEIPKEVQTDDDH